MDERLNTWLQMAKRASAAASAEIRAVYRTAFEVETKADESPLTLADQRAHTAIVRELLASGLPVLSEEGRHAPYAERSAWEYFWMVDPLDGTKEFVKRNGEFTVNIALMHRHSPVFGIIEIPEEDTLYWGGKGLGAFRQRGRAGGHSGAQSEEQLTGRPLTDAFTVVGSRSHDSPETRRFLEAVEAEHGPLAFISKGSSLKFCMLAEGRAQLYPRMAPTMEWDTASGHAIVEGVGFQVLKWPGNEPLKYNKPDLLNPWFMVR